MLRPWTASGTTRRGLRRAIPALVLGTALLTATGASGAEPPIGADPTVITAWNEIAVTTIAGPAPSGAGKANAEAFLWYGFVQAAVYNAVNGITTSSTG